MKKTFTALMAVTMLAGVVVPPVAAQPYGSQNQGQYQGQYQGQDQRDRDQRDQDRRDNRFTREQRDQAYRDGYRAGYETARLRRRYNDRPNYNDGPVVGDDRGSRWNSRYRQAYTYNDDVYYRNCRNRPDPAGVIAGAFIGGLLGNAAGGRAGGTLAGVVLGGAAGAALTTHLDCDDQSYAYKSYHDGFNSGRPNSTYQWSNPQNNHRGEFVVGSYYNDPDNFRCATYRQSVYINNRREETSGRACQQPDGTWTIVS